MDLEAIREYADLTRMLRSLPLIKDGILEAEHGGTTDDNGGGCIAHTHVNILPGLGNLVDLFTPILPLITTLQEISEIRAVKEPYIFLCAESKSGSAFLARGLPSQFIRRTLAAHLGLTGWDWRTVPNPDVIEKTINLWESALANA